MGTLPGTRFATAEPSGRTGQVLWSPPSQGGGEQIAQGIERLGAVALSYALNVQKQEMTAEYYEKRRLIDEAGWAARESVIGDEEADNALLENLQSNMKAIAGSSKYKGVNDDLMNHVNEISPNWEHGIRMASLGIREQNARDSWKLNMVHSLETGTWKEAADKALEVKAISQPEYDYFVKTAPSQTHLALAERFVNQGNYNLALAELEQMDKMELTTEQLKDKRTLTLYAKNKANELSDQQIQAVHQLAIKDVSPDVIRAKIDQSDGLTPIQKTELWKEYNGAMAVRNKTGIDPFRETRDWPSYMQTKIDIAVGKITTPLEIYEKAMSDPEKGPLWSYVQINDLVTDLPGNKSDVLKNPFYEQWDKQIDLIYEDEYEDIPKEKIPEWAKAKDQLKQIAATTGNDYSKAQSQIEQFLTPVKEEKTKGWFSQWWQDTRESMTTGEGVVYRRKRLAKERDLMFGGDLYGVLIQRYPDKEDLILKAKANGWSAEAIAESLK